MGKVLSLGKARKIKARAADKAAAAVNRAAHGRTKADKLAEKQRAMRANAALDQAKRDK